MCEVEIVEKFLERVEIAVRQLFRDNMKDEPYTRPSEYYPDAFAEVLSEMERACEKSSCGLENTQESLSGMQGAT